MNRVTLLNRFTRRCFPSWLCSALILVFLHEVAINKSADALSKTIYHNSEEYSVTTVEGSFSDLASELQAVSWWDRPLVAEAIAELIGGTFGYPNDSLTYGPYVAVTLDSNVGLLTYAYNANNASPDLFPWSVSTVRTYLTVTPSLTAVPFSVPGGATIPTLGTIIAIVGMRRIKKRKQAT